MVFLRVNDITLYTVSKKNETKKVFLQYLLQTQAMKFGT